MNGKIEKYEVVGGFKGVVPVSTVLYVNMSTCQH
jgi:hypothetical protein